MEKRIRSIISGRVQLVMYRDFARRKARKLRLRGWVRNLPDNTVELIAEGEEENLKHLIEYLKEGPVLADVDDVQVTWWDTATGEFKDFEIKYE